MTRLEALHILGLSIEDIATIRRAFLRALEHENAELLRSFK